MSSCGLNLCTLSGNVAADPEIRDIEFKVGGHRQVANLTIYVNRIPRRTENDSFTVNISVWEGSAAWRKLPHIRKGSLIIASGAIDVHAYLSKTDAQARASLKLNATDIFLDSSPKVDDPSPDLVAAGQSF
jgi:single-stranded DNA-binding protein